MDDQESTDAMLTLAEATGDIVHAVNNHLNSLLLQAACVQLVVSGEARQQIDAMRSEARKAAGLLRALQIVRPWPVRPGEQADATEAARSCTGIDLDLPDGPTMVAGSAAGLRRLMSLLTRLARRAVREPNRATMHLNAQRVRVGLPGVTLDVDDEGKPALAIEAGPGLPELEQKAARWIARNMNRRLEYEALPGGAAMTVTW